jgi:hypothetical protein
MLCVHGCQTWRRLRCCQPAFFDAAGIGEEAIVGGIRAFLWGKARDRIGADKARQTAVAGIGIPALERRWPG